MSKRAYTRTTVHTPLTAKKWTTLPVDAKRALTLLVNDKCDFDALVQLRVEGLPVGATAQVRFIVVGYDRDGKKATTTIRTYPVIEADGTTGATFITAPAKGSLKARKGSIQERLRVQINVPVAGAKVTLLTSHIDHQNY